jgi:dephospho-CoA kinase
MLNIALTGNVAAGKSTVADWFRRWGATLIDADQLVREVEAPGGPVLEAIAQEFGTVVLLPDGALDRQRLRAIVLENADRRRALEAIVHPAVQVRRQARVEEARRAGASIVVNDIPLLFEVLDPGAFDAVVLVDAPESVRFTRLLRDRGLSETEARRLMAAQGPSAPKRAWRGGPANRPALLIENDGDMVALEQRARAVWEELQSRVNA